MKVVRVQIHTGRELTNIIEDGTSGTRHHLFITGTGRAGTSFLVRFMAAMGLDTHMQRHLQPGWSDEANAGLEDMPLGTVTGDLPYVVKSPWLSEFVDDLLANKAIHIDAVIVPIRDLVEAATSRVVQELRTSHQSQPWPAECSHTSETWGTTPGGVVFSLNPVDQGRLLAVWLYRLIQRLEHAEIPTVFLDFPRLAEDPDYLFRKLQQFLPAGATLEQARAAHAQVADRQKIRVGGELQRAAATPEIPAMAEYPDLEALDRIALAREIRRLKAELDQGRAAANANASRNLEGPAAVEIPALAEASPNSQRWRGLAGSFARAVARRFGISRPLRT